MALLEHLVNVLQLSVISCTSCTAVDAMTLVTSKQLENLHMHQFLVSEHPMQRSSQEVQHVAKYTAPVSGCPPSNIHLIGCVQDCIEDPCLGCIFPERDCSILPGNKEEIGHVYSASNVLLRRT